MKSFILSFYFTAVLIFSLSSAQAEYVVFEVTGKLNNSMHPFRVEENKWMLDLLEYEIKSHLDGVPAKMYKSFHEFNKVVLENYKKNPSDWESYDVSNIGYSIYNIIQKEFTNRSDTSLSPEDYYRIINTFVAEKDADLLKGEKFEKNILPYVFPFLFKGSNWTGSKDRGIRWALQLPVMIEDTAYSASLVDLPSITGKISDKGHLMRLKIRIDGIKPEHKKSKKIKVLSDPFLFVKEAILENIGLEDCHYNNLGENPSLSTFHTFIKADKKFAQCSKKYSSSFTKLSISSVIDGRPHEKIYPEFNEIYKETKPTVDLLILSSHGDGFGFSNYINLVSKYTKDHSNQNRHSQAELKKGDFDIIFESSKERGIIIPFSNFKAYGDRYTVLERNSKEKEQSFRLHLIYNKDYSYEDILAELSPKMDLIVYQGHSGYGASLSTFSKVPLSTKKYQSLFVLACNSFDYVFPNFMFAKSFADFEPNALYWDFIGSQYASPLWHSEKVLRAYIDFYVNAWIKYHKNENLEKFNYKTLLDNLNKADKGISKWKAAGINKNQWRPGEKEISLSETLLSLDRKPSILNALNFLISNKDLHLRETFVSYLKDEARVPKTLVKEVLEDFQSSPENSDIDKSELKNYFK